jgi:hypothetical protein
MVPEGRETKSLTYRREWVLVKPVALRPFRHFRAPSAERCEIRGYERVGRLDWRCGSVGGIGSRQLCGDRHYGLEDWRHFRLPTIEKIRQALRGSVNLYWFTPVTIRAKRCLCKVDRGYRRSLRLNTFHTPA